MFGKSTFGSTGGFGQQPQQSNVFGQQQPQQQPSAFGGFGAAATPSAFGSATPAATSAFGQPAQTSAFGGGAQATGAFGANTGSAFGQSRPAGFGSTPAFGTAQSTPAFGGFGSTSSAATPAFGATANQSGSSVFGQARPGGFGSTSTTPAFGGATGGAFGSGGGAQPSAFGSVTTGGAFGQPAQGANGTAVVDFSPTQDRDITSGINNFFQTITAMPQYKNYSIEELRLQDYAQNRKTANAAGAAGGFGASTGNTAFGSGSTPLFGQSANTSTPFGQQATNTAFGQPQTTNAFGAANTGATGGAFGQQATATPAFGNTGNTGFGNTGFGAANNTGFGATNAGFGASNTAAKPLFGQAATGGFGASTTPAFGQSATPAFGQQTSTPAFGQANQTQSGFGGFGQKPATSTATGFGGGFGGGFGSTATSKPATGFGFGATSGASNTGATGFGGFGASGTSAPTFGTSQPAQQTSGMFGAKPATTSLFGNTQPATGGFSFGGQQQQQQQQQQSTSGFGTGGGLFGQKPATGTNLFGNAQNTTSGFGGFGNQQAGNTGTFALPATGGLTSFGTSGLQPGQQQQPLIATVDSRPYGANPLFDNVKATPGQNTGPMAVSLANGSKHVTPPHYPIAPRTVSKIKLRGFALSQANRTRSQKMSSLEGVSDDSLLGPGAFTLRTSNKKLVFDKDVSYDEVSNLANKNTSKPKLIFDPQLEMAALKREVPATVQPPATPVNIKAPPEAFAKSTEKQGYYMSPTLETLKGMSKDELKQVEGFKVGRRGYGEVKFNVAVDLSETDLNDIMGSIVVIEDKSIVIYPDDGNKPAEGQGLNVSGTVKLENCFSVDKDTKKPIKDPEHPRFKMFFEKLRKRPGVEFVDYEVDSGTWTFKVQHF